MRRKAGMPLCATASFLPFSHVYRLFPAPQRAAGHCLRVDRFVYGGVGRRPWHHNALTLSPCSPTWCAGDRWQQAPDGIKGHEGQYWTPLQFDSIGRIAPVRWLDTFTLNLSQDQTS